MNDFVGAVLIAFGLFIPLRLLGRSFERAGRRIERQRGIHFDQIHADREARGERPDAGL